MRAIALVLVIVFSWPTLASEPSCSERLATALAAPQASPAQPDWSVLRDVAAVSIEGPEPVTPWGGAPGFLFVVRCVDDFPQLVWWTPGEETSTFRLPLERRTEEEEGRWNFLAIETVGDLDGDGTLEAFVVGTGGAGMYHHWPILVGIDAEGARVLYAPEEPFFYGGSELLPSETQGKILLSVRSVDRDAPWAFSQPSVGPHPFVDQVLEISQGQAEVRERHPVASESQTLSDFILAVRSGLWREARAFLADDGTIAGVVPKNARALQKAVLAVHLPGTRENDCSLRWDEKARLSFRCETDSGSLHYLASFEQLERLHKIRSLQLLGPLERP